MTLQQLKIDSKLTFAVIFPCKNEGKTIGHICESIINDGNCMGLLDELVVMNDNSTDNTHGIVSSIFSKYRNNSNNCKFCLFNTGSITHYNNIELPKYNGKGIVLWKSLFLAKSEILIFIDGDHETYELIPQWIIQFITQFLNNNKLQFVKGYFSENIKNRNGVSGRVSDLVMLPITSILYPNIVNNNNCIHLGCGEQAARKSWLIKIENFPAHYAIEVCLWIEANMLFSQSKDNRDCVSCDPTIEVDEDPIFIKQIDLKRKHARKQDTKCLRLMAATIMSYLIKRKFNLFGVNNGDLVLGNILASQFIDKNDCLIDKFENINDAVLPSVCSIIQKCQKIQECNTKTAHVVQFRILTKFMFVFVTFFVCFVFSSL